MAQVASLLLPNIISIPEFSAEPFQPQTDKLQLPQLNHKQENQTQTERESQARREIILELSTNPNQEVDSPLLHWLTWSMFTCLKRLTLEKISPNGDLQINDTHHTQKKWNGERHPSKSDQILFTNFVWKMLAWHYWSILSIGRSRELLIRYELFLFQLTSFSTHDFGTQLCPID